MVGTFRGTLDTETTGQKASVTEPRLPGADNGLGPIRYLQLDEDVEEYSDEALLKRKSLVCSRGSSGNYDHSIALCCYGSERTDFQGSRTGDR